MNDKELLIRAANAAGYDDATWHDMGPLGVVRHGFSEAIWSQKIYEENDTGYWNPLADKSDLYYLAKKLHILIEFKHQYAAYDNPNNPIIHLPHEIIVRWPIDAKDDVYAVVMVAAEIGRTK